MENLSYLLIKTSRILKNSLDKKLNEYNITASQFSVLNQIANKNEMITSAEVADILESDRPTISGVINRLEEKGLVQKTLNSEDKRSSYLKLSKESLKLVGELRMVSDQLNAEIFTDFSESEKKNIKSYLLKIMETVEHI